MIKKIELVEHDFKGDLFVDIGGNIGMWTKELYPHYKKIFFVEPSQQAIEIAKQNINDTENKIKYFKNICSDKVGEKKTIYSCTKDTGNFSVFGKDLYSEISLAEENIETITLDSLMELCKDDKEVTIKVDTEGADLDILLGGFDFIKEKKPSIIMEAHFHMYYSEEKFNKIKNFLRDLDYEIHQYKNPNYLAQASYIFDGKHNGNQMYNMHYQIIFKPRD